MKLPSFLQREPNPDMTAHTPGIRMGNQPGGYEKMPGHTPDGRSTAARATGINAADRDPIDPRSPKLTPP